MLFWCTHAVEPGATSDIDKHALSLFFDLCMFCLGLVVLVSYSPFSVFVHVCILACIHMFDVDYLFLQG